MPDLFLPLNESVTMKADIHDDCCEIIVMLHLDQFHFTLDAAFPFYHTNPEIWLNKCKGWRVRVETPPHHVPYLCGKSH